MTSRRRVATFSFSPDGNSAADLERKLELLEARFTMPLHFPSHHHNDNSSSPATLDPENSSPASVQSSSRHGNSTTNSRSSAAYPTLSNHTNPSHSQKVSSSQHSFRGDRRANDGNYVENSWQDITNAHIARMQQQETSMMNQDSQSTLITSHVHHENAISSPMRIAPTHCEDSQTAGPLSNAPASNVTKAAENKRKRMPPTKRPLPPAGKSEPVASDATTMNPPPPTNVTSVTNNDDGRKRNRPNTSEPPSATIRSPSRISASTFSSKSNSPRSSRGPKAVAADSNSREPSIHKKALAAITNNAKISDFFASTKPKRPAVLPYTDAPIVPQNETDLVSNENGVKEALISPSVKSDALEALQRRYDELLRTCQDKDEQLKAVSNNRTILHTALQSALRQRENEYEALKVETEEKDAKYRDTLEELVRTDACQEARELREKLAADGARLGRILSVPRPNAGRMLLGSHRAPLESWEDGYASKELQEKLKELQAKKVILEERQKLALLAGENFREEPTLTPVNPTPGEDKGDISHRDNVPTTALDVREAIESARYHLNNVRQQERELALAEQALNDEKGAHIRALKRVASEDASRFRTRPKLHDRYVLRSLLGKGGFSEVWLAFDLIDLREVAVKIHQLDSRWPDSKKENYTKHVSREYEIHRSVRHPRIVSLYDVFEIDNNSFATVLESCEGTDLDTLLKVKRRLPEQDARAILLQILSGMNYLSHPSKDGTRQGIIHYDLKPGNILFDQYGDAKITDFGLSKIVDAPDPGDSMELTSQGAGTYWYLPPECFILDDDVRISNKVDVWSIGVIFYQMLFGKRPFGDGQSQDKMLKDGTMLNARSVLFPERPEVTSACKEFIEACLTYDQQFRPTIAQICEHPYVLAKDLQN